MFEFKVQKEQLVNPLLMVAGAVDKKQSLTILSHVLMKCANQQLMLTATDLEIEITAILSCPSLQEEGAITVPARKVVDIIRSLNDSACPVFSCDGKTLTIKEGRSLFKLTTLPAEQYPNAEDECSDVEFTINRLAFMQLLQSTYFSMAHQDVRVYLSGLLLDFQDKTLIAVATDGHRMAIGRLFCSPLPTERRFLIPRKGVVELLRLLNSMSDETVVFSAGKHHIRVQSSYYTFVSKLLEARFPPYLRAIPKTSDKHILVERNELRQALSRIMILAHEKSKAIVLHMKPSQLTLVANNQEQEEAIETLSVHTEGDELKIGMNASYLLDVLNHIKDGPLRLSMSRADSSVLIESDDCDVFQYIIMPMKL